MAETSAGPSIANKLQETSTFKRSNAIKIGDFCSNMQKSCISLY